MFFFFRQVAGKNRFSLPLIRGVKNCRSQSGRPKPQPREKLVRCYERDCKLDASGSRDLFTVQRDLFARAQSARDIYLSSKQSPTIWNMYSATAVRSTVPARSYLTSVCPSVHLSHTSREECTLRFA